MRALGCGWGAVWWAQRGAESAGEGRDVGERSTWNGWPSVRDARLRIREYGGRDALIGDRRFGRVGG